MRRLKNGGANSLWPPGSTVAVLTVLQYKNEFLKKAVILGVAPVGQANKDLRLLYLSPRDFKSKVIHF